MFFYSNHINTLEFVWLINEKAKCSNENLTHGVVLSLISKRAFLRKLSFFHWYENQVTMNPMVVVAINCMRWENKIDREFHALAKLVVNRLLKGIIHIEWMMLPVIIRCIYLVLWQKVECAVFVLPSFSFCRCKNNRIGNSVLNKLKACLTQFKRCARLINVKSRK